MVLCGAIFDFITEKIARVEAAAATVEVDVRAKEEGGGWEERGDHCSVKRENVDGSIPRRTNNQSVALSPKNQRLVKGMSIEGRKNVYTILVTLRF